MRRLGYGRNLRAVRPIVRRVGRYRNAGLISLLVNEISPARSSYATDACGWAAEGSDPPGA
ncbi:hypothetical protein [Salinispora arenicola]|uniref:hypothetical protein n=1 Tax=Salinispora arenicola TaxID=168697 RepID=UPI00035E2B84|nr:hypothetical protein [Salinispora arenicola]